MFEHLITSFFDAVVEFVDLTLPYPLDEAYWG
jgi:hypothetical protein